MVLFFVSYDLYNSILYIKYYIIGVLEFDIKNKEVSENYMSKPEKYQYDVLLYIIENGEPCAVYEVAYNGLNMKQPTVRNIFQRLEKGTLIAKYENGSRRKLMYGPTWNGLVALCGENPKIKNELDTILDAWFIQPKFIENLKDSFGEVVTKNPDHAKTLVKKMLKYLGRISVEVEKFTEDDHILMEMVFGEQALITKYPTEMNNVLEFYKHVKFYRENILRQIESQRTAQKLFESIHTG